MLLANRPDPSTAPKHLSHSPGGQQCGSVGGWQASSSLARPRKPSPGARAAPAALASASVALARPTCAGLSSDIPETSGPFSCCQQEGPCLPASPQIAQQAPHCPGHLNGRFTRRTSSHAHSPPALKKGRFNGRSVAVCKGPHSAPPPRCPGTRGLSGGSFHRRRAHVMENRPKAGARAQHLPRRLEGGLRLEEGTLARARAPSVLHTECLSKQDLEMLSGCKEAGDRVAAR